MTAHANLREDLVEHHADLERALAQTPRWRVLRRFKLLQTQVSTLARYVVLLDEQRVAQINASRRRVDG